ncbi:MAG: RpiB/LacA/LacB family sugar-phosphate isomerase [Planctomycetota bacterium]|jgi:ribose 5-phosphate isomerase B|nr:RpiB/LacA/LacB family sugar-phosphate isomerase [Planctomycetota bacterium]
MPKKTIVMGSDDAALGLKNELAKFLTAQGYTIEDVGIYDADDATVYPRVAERACQAIIDSGFTKKGILVCGTGIGMAMSANKVAGIRAAQTHDTFSAERAALSNDSHIITMGARVIGSELAKKIVMAWLPLKFKPGSSSPKVAAIMELEKSRSAQGKNKALAKPRVKAGAPGRK